MEYQNRLPPEGINTSRVHPLKQLAHLLIAALILIVLLVALLQFSGSFLAKQIPFETELQVMEHLDMGFDHSQKHPELTEYLNTLANELFQSMTVADEFSFRVHYSEEAIFNAFATIGGNLFFYKDLLQAVPDENTLAMVMAHEMAHVIHRDPIASLGGGIVAKVGALALTGSSGVRMAGGVLDDAGVLTTVQFTRRMELNADQLALKVLNSRYGHLAGSVELFRLFSQQDQSLSTFSQDLPDWLERFVSTHPLDQDRIDKTLEYAKTHNLTLDGPRTSLPLAYKQWLNH